MNETSLTLSALEREYLADLLQLDLKETRVEQRRTRTTTFREQVVEREDMIRGILAKLGVPEAASPDAGD